MPSGPSGSSSPHRAPAWLRRVTGAQEFGLAVVIALMVLVLSLVHMKPGQERVALPAGATAAAGAEGVAVTMADGETKIYPSREGWRLRPGEQGGGAVERAVRRLAFGVNHGFLNRANLVGVLRDSSFIAIMAVAAAGVIIMGGIDLSVGSVYALSAVAGAMALQRLGAGGETVSGWSSVPVGVGVCCVIGFACGAINGLGTVLLKVHPFIITLGGMAVYRGIAFVTTGGQSITGFPSSYTIGFFKVESFGVNPMPVMIMIVVGLIGAFILSRMVFGRRVFAIGGSEIAARYAGVPVERTKVIMFALGGLTAGLSAAVMLGYYGSASSADGPAYELRVIAAAVVGGASLSGGRGSAIGAVLGAIVIQLIDNGIVVLGVDSNYTNIVIGLAIVLAVVVDQTKHRLSAGRR